MTLLERIKSKQGIRKLAGAGTSQASAHTAPLSEADEYIEKLASALEYAAQNLPAVLVPSPQPAPEQATYRRDPDFRKIASAQPGFLAARLKEKIAEKQRQSIADQDAVDASILRNIVSRISTTSYADNARDEQPDPPAVEIEEEVDPIELAARGIDFGDEDGRVAKQTEAQDAGMFATSEQTGSLADVVRSALAAKGTSESGASDSSGQTVKTAGARGKGPMAVADATNLLRERLKKSR